MHLAKIEIENFRIFGSGDRGLSLALRPGLTMLVGPNDGGKTAIVDAIRLVVGTTARDLNRVVEDDFHLEAPGKQAETLRIACRFEFPDPAESSLFFEYLTPGLTPTLTLVLTAARGEGTGRRQVTSEVRSGERGDGPRPDATMRGLIGVTYLRALRDALAELTAGRGSRLSQILENHPQYRGQETSDFAASKIVDGSVKVPETLVGIMRLAEYAIETNAAVSWTRDRLNDEYLQRLSLKNQQIRGEVGITREAQLRDVLEKLDLWVNAVGTTEGRLKRGLGTNNVLYMASEMLLVGASPDDALPLLLIEEPEAHLHPQLQLLVGDYLRAQAGKKPSGSDAMNPLQVVATTHSPVLASQVSLNQVVMIVAGNAYPLARGQTGLAPDDYGFLRRFLNATRANLFFAEGVIIVEGDAENLLLPTLATLIGRSLTEYGVSIVNVGSVGLFRYSRIFQSPERGPRIPVRVACVTDSDLPHDADAAAVERRKASRRRNDGGPVRTFVSPFHTLEYVLAFGPFAREMYTAIAIAQASIDLGELPGSEVLEDANAGYDALVAATPDEHERVAKIYEPLKDGKASKAETAQYFAALVQRRAKTEKLASDAVRAMLPEYLVDAIEHATVGLGESPVPPPLAAPARRRRNKADA